MKMYRIARITKTGFKYHSRIENSGSYTFYKDIFRARLYKSLTEAKDTVARIIDKNIWWICNWPKPKLDQLLIEEIEFNVTNVHPVTL
jgi:hypothetical protein